MRPSDRATERTPVDPLTLVMFGLIAVLIFFMFRNGKKRQQAQQEMQNNLRPGAQVMLQSGIFGTIESVDDEENRVTVRSGDSSLVVHRNAIGQIVAPADAVEEPETELAPDDDPQFGERVGDQRSDSSESGPDAADDGRPAHWDDSSDASGNTESDDPESDTPKA